MEKEKLLDAIKQAAMQAGIHLLSGQQQLKDLVVTEKSSNQLVSKIDVETEKIIVAALLRIFPDAGFITEEQTIATAAKPLHFIIDPLDGTTNYLHGLDLYSVSIAAVLNGQLTAGVVYVPSRNELFSAIQGKGAFLNDQRISVSASNKLKDSLLATGFPYYNFEGKEAYIKSLDYLMQHTRGLRRMGSAAIDLAYTANGRFCGFFELHLQTWDVAAGILLVQEAGGIVSDFAGIEGDISGKEILASNPSIYAVFKSVLANNFGNGVLHLPEK